MEVGAVSVEGPGLGFWFYPFSWQHLWWNDRSGRLRLVRSGKRAPALRCPACGLVAIQPTPG